jgi:tRNA(Ile)-lysidine synthase
VLVAEAEHALTGIFDGLTGLPCVAVAVSGGSDSMALLHLVHQWRAQNTGPRKIIALTFDHGLRSESADEAKAVSQWCAELDVAHHTLRWPGLKPETGIQAKARVARYDALSDWCLANGVGVLMTGHTADDQAETVVMRQQRTTSARSLAAIWPENEWKGVRLLRPLLGQRRSALRSFLQKQGQTWLDDPSNTNTKFERVRVREALVADAVPALAQQALAAQTQVRVVDRLRDEWVRFHAQVDAYAVVRLPRKLLEAEQHEVRIAILAWALQLAGDGEAVEAAQLQTISQWLTAGARSRRSLRGAILSARQTVIEVMREPGRIKTRWQTVGESGVLRFDGRFIVNAPPGSSIGPMGQPPLVKRARDVPNLAFSALPAVKFASGEVVSAVEGGNNQVSAMLCERFML